MTIEVALPQAIICQIKPHETREVRERNNNHCNKFNAVLWQLFVIHRLDPIPH